jgi:RHS repeat-associated protein
MSYDILGRLTCSTTSESPTTSEGSALFYYDEIDGRSAYGKLLRTVGPGKFHQAYTEDLYYDSQLRLIQKKIKIGDEEEQIFSYAHDTLGRLDTVTYPSGFAVKYEYADGTLKKVYRANDPTLVYWQAQELNADGTVIEEQKGDGLIVTKQTDLLGRPYLLQKNSSYWQAYVYDEVGNVTTRYNGLLGAPAEEFAYDSLNRLINRSVASLSLSDTYSYGQTQGGNLGNLTGKPDLGELYYGGTSGSATIPPHAINYVTTTTGTHYFDYDANGNITAYFDRSLYWNAENRLTFIRDQNSASAFFYSPTGAMLKKTGFAYHSGSFAGRAAINREKVSETLYVDGLYEINKENGNTARKHLIKAGSNSVAVYTETTGTSPATTLRYLYYDHLGSLDSITNESGTVIHTASFDAWGRERNPYYFVTPFNPDNQYLNIPETDITDLGYTGHRQVGNFGLVHMRGRVYDPLLGRFLSPDPIIQYPLDLQTYNRYAYVRNNPLTYIDPSGYGFLKSFKKFFKKVVAPVLGMVLTGGGMHFIAAGFLSGGVGAAVNGGNILKGAVTGAFSAAAFNWAGHGAHNIRPIQAHFVAGAVSSGFSASIYGGSMGRAALTGGISGALGESATLNNRFKNLTPGKFHMGQFSATVAAGGIGSYLSGGGFEAGAYTAAMGYAFNEMLERRRMAFIEESYTPRERGFLGKYLKNLRRQGYEEHALTKENYANLIRHATDVNIITHKFLGGRPTIDLYGLDQVYAPNVRTLELNICESSKWLPRLQPQYPHAEIRAYHEVNVGFNPTIYWFTGRSSAPTAYPPLIPLNNLTTPVVPVIWQGGVWSGPVNY